MASVSNRNLRNEHGANSPRECLSLDLEEAVLAKPCQQQSSASPKQSLLLSCVTNNTTILKKALAETIGTFMLMYTGCGAVMMDEKSNGQISHLGVAISFGLVITIIIYAIGHISGAHVNPAVTIAFAFVRHFPWSQVPIYIGSQLVGAIAASFALRLTFGFVGDLAATSPTGSNIQSFVLELIISFILMFVVSAVTTDSCAIGELAGLAIGCTVCLNVIFAGPVSGASMNPARSIGPALASGRHVKLLWIYIVGPIIGALAGALSYKIIQLQETIVDLGVGPTTSSKTYPL